MGSKLLIQIDDDIRVKRKYKRRKKEKKEWKVYLASASPRRKELLERFNFDFEVMVSNVSEYCDYERPEDYTCYLAEMKAKAVACQIDDGIVIGADTIVVAGGKILGKPDSERSAYRMLNKLQGTYHDVMTGVSIFIVENGRPLDWKTFVETTHVHVSEMSRDEIYRYIHTGEPFDKAGGYGIQGRFAVHVNEIEGDYYNVVGLPVCRLYHELMEFVGEDLFD